jgi:hypothetical protein
MVIFIWPSTLKALPRSVPTTKQNIMIPVKYLQTRKLRVKKQGSKNQLFSKMSNKDLFVYFVYDLIFSGEKISVCTDEPFD